MRVLALGLAEMLLPATVRPVNVELPVADQVPEVTPTVAVCVTSPALIRPPRTLTAVTIGLRRGAAWRCEEAGWSRDAPVLVPITPMFTAAAVN